MNPDQLTAELTKRFNIIAIDGPIGVGKTTLLESAGEVLGLKTLKDKVSGDDLLGSFYSNIERMAFSTQVLFATKRSELWKEIQQTSSDETVVVDFLPQRELIFAENNLKEPEKGIFTGLYSLLFSEGRQPDAIVYLTADTDVLMERIGKRGRSFEGRITRKYLQNISDRFHKYFFTLEGKPVLVVNTNNYDIVRNQNSVLDIFSQLLNTRSELQYYTPPDVL